jgi:hypothetical protein
VNGRTVAGKPADHLDYVAHDESGPHRNQRTHMPLVVHAIEPKGAFPWPKVGGSGMIVKTEVH